MKAGSSNPSINCKDTAAGKNSCNDSILITYSCTENKFTYLSDMKLFPADFDSRPLWEIMAEDGFASDGSVDRLRSGIEEIRSVETPQAKYTELSLKNVNGEWRHWRAGIICTEPGRDILITLTDTGNAVASRTDELTGLMTRRAFCRAIEPVLEKNHEKAAGNGYAMIYFDIIKFKAVNEHFGMEKGDALLIYIADTLRSILGENGMCCRIGSDRFAAFMDSSAVKPEVMLEGLSHALACCGLPFEITYNAGVYITCAEQVSPGAMIDRAIIAQSAIKGNYNFRYEYYTENLRKDMLSEQEIVGMMSAALTEKHFVVYYQPQYNHSTGMLIGAEALARWKHPERGLISPGIFIPIFEKNGFITNLDLYIFEEVCIFLRNCIDRNHTLIPVSTNFSRYDIFYPGFVEKLEEIRSKYDVPVKYIRVELTESSIIGGSKRTNEVVCRLRECGYIVEMDDFGSGYSSLNVLKDIELDMIKLDMRFLSADSESNKGGTIISSVVRMAKWLSMPVIAEGVETVQQADFLRSIGCDYIQGYLYSKPLPEENYIGLISGSSVGATVPQMKLIDTLNACDFWNPSSLETLIFSNYVGGAAIFDYHNGKIEILRVNQKYLSEICMNLSEKELIESDPMAVFDEGNKQIYLYMLERAIETGEEQECETWRTLSSLCCGNERICIRSTVRMLGKSVNSTLFYAMIRNVTAEKQYYGSILESERRFKMASEQVNIYYWEYTIATKEMRPCFRCMRDLGLPALLNNYPEPAIERGIFPPEVADMYRDWHKKIAEGVPQLEAVIPLTPDRVPFRVRYTTEFDANGNPVKAYGSAALVV